MAVKTMTRDLPEYDIWQLKSQFKEILKEFINENNIYLFQIITFDCFKNAKFTSQTLTYGTIACKNQKAKCSHSFKSICFSAISSLTFKGTYCFKFL